MSSWLTPLGANDDLEYQATYAEMYQDAQDFIEYVRRVKGYRPYQHYFRPGQRQQVTPQGAPVQCPMTP